MYFDIEDFLEPSFDEEGIETFEPGDLTMKTELEAHIEDTVHDPEAQLLMQMETEGWMELPWKQRKRLARRLFRILRGWYLIQQALEIAIESMRERVDLLPFMSQRHPAAKIMPSNSSRRVRHPLNPCHCLSGQEKSEKTAANQHDRQGGAESFLVSLQDEFGALQGTADFDHFVIDGRYEEQSDFVPVPGKQKRAIRRPLGPISMLLRSERSESLPLT